MLNERTDDTNAVSTHVILRKKLFKNIKHLLPRSQKLKGMAKRFALLLNERTDETNAVSTHIIPRNKLFNNIKHLQQRSQKLKGMSIALCTIAK